MPSSWDNAVATRGCVRMSSLDVTELYELVPAEAAISGG
jgi:lipoprotein-anchoring transpeptidase ErfK/SrfK